MANPFSLEGKNAWITGASYGIGFNIAKAFVEAGIKTIIFNDINEAALQRGLDNYKAAGIENVKGYVCDVTDEVAIKALVEKIHEEVGQIDILVNNAANVALKDGRVDELTLEMFDDIVQSDLRGTFYAIKCALPFMLENGGGSIVNIGSMASCGGDLGSTAYACAKAGVDILTQYTAQQYGKQGIRCNCIRPGLIVTPQNEGKVPQALKDIFLGSIMVDRYGCPEDIAHAAVYFGSDESAYCTGQIINIDGGMNSHAPTVAQFRELGSRTW